MSMNICMHQAGRGWQGHRGVGDSPFALQVAQRGRYADDTERAECRCDDGHEAVSCYPSLDRRSERTWRRVPTCQRPDSAAAASWALFCAGGGVAETRPRPDVVTDRSTEDQRRIRRDPRGAPIAASALAASLRRCRPNPAPRRRSGRPARPGRSRLFSRCAATRTPGATGRA